MNRCTPLRRHTPMRRRSKRRARIGPARAALVRRLLTERPYCEAGIRLAVAVEGHACSELAVHVHETLTRARGGDILDEAICLCVCAACHDRIHAEPVLSLRLGFLRSGCGRTA